MLELDTNKVKSLDFEIQLSGIDPKQLEGSLRILIDGIEYGFKAEVNPSNIVVNVPMLKNILQREFKEGEQFEAKLEAHGAGYYLNPWNGLFVIKNPVSMQVAIKEDIVVPKIVAKVKSEAKDKLTEIKKVVPKIPVQEPKKVKKAITEEKVLKSNIVLTEKHIFAYMKSKGTTSKQVQNLILERCKTKSKSDKPLDVLRSVVKFYKEKTSINSNSSSVINQETKQVSSKI